MADKKKSPVGGPGLPAGVKSSGDKLNERELKRSQTYVAQNPPPENRPTKQGNQKKASPVGGPGLPKTQTVRYTVTPNSGVKRGASVGKTVSSARNTVENQKLDRREAKRSERYKEEEAQKNKNKKSPFMQEMPAEAAMHYEDALRREFTGLSPDELRKKAGEFEQVAMRAPRKDIADGYMNKSRALFRIADRVERERILSNAKKSTQGMMRKADGEYSLVRDALSGKKSSEEKTEAKFDVPLYKKMDVATDTEIEEGRKLFDKLSGEIDGVKSFGLVQLPKADAEVKLARFYAVGEILAKWYEERGMTQEMYDVRSRVSDVRWQEAQGRFGYHSEPGGGDAYRDAQARAKADGFAKKYVGKQYDFSGGNASDWWNQFGANYGSSRIGVEGAEAATAYAKNPTPGNKYYLDTIKNVSDVYHGKNDGIVGSGGLFNKSVASQLPQFLKQAEANVKGATVGGMLGFLAGGNIGKGMKWGAVAGSGIYGYEQAYGYSFVNLSEQTDFETAKKLAHDEAVLSSGVEMVDTAKDIIGLGYSTVLKLFGKEAAKKIGKESLLKILGKYAVETLGEGAEEGVQEILSIANERRLSNGDVDSGVFGLLAECKNVIRDMAAGKSPDDVARVKESAHEGVKVGAVMGGAQLGVNTAISSVAGQNGAQVPPNAKNPAAETQQDSGKVTFEDVVNSGKGDDEPDVVFMTGAGAKNSPKYDYTKPFSQQVDDFKNKKIPKDDSLLVGGTGDVYQGIGLNALPMAIDQTHVDYMLNGTKDSDHSLGEAFLKQLPEAMQKPIAIIASESRKHDSIVALLPFVHNGKQVIAPVHIDGSARFNNVRFDVNAVSSVYAKRENVTANGRIKWEAADMLNYALSEEAQGNTSVYYWNKKEALALLQRSGFLMPGGLPKGGFVHSIRENGSKVKPKFENVTETQQFQRWFKNSDVTGTPPSKIVDSDGKPAAKFYQEMRRTSSGDYLYVFSGNEATASRLPQTPKAIDSKSAYLNMARPMKKTITAAQYRDAQFMAGLVSLAKKNRHDGLILDLKENGRTVDTIFAVFDKAQMKSTENMGSFFRDTSDPMYSAGTELDEEYVSPENAVALKEAEEVFGRLGFTVTTVPHVQNMPENVDGYVDFTNKEVYINPKAENAQEVVIKHELTHILERSRGSRYVRSAMDAIKRKMPKAWEEAYQKNWEKYEELSKSNPDLAPTRARIESETLADFSVYFAKDDVIRHYAKNPENRSFMQTMIDFWHYIKLQAKAMFGKDESVFWNNCARKWEKALDVAVQDDGNVHDSGDGAGSDVLYKIVGERADGIEVYETSDAVKKMPYKERNKEFLRIMREEYRGRTAKFTKNGHTYYARFEDVDLNKNVYGDKKSDKKGVRAKSRVGADGNIFELVENARYDRSGVEKGKSTKAHSGIDRWDYFVKTIQIDGTVYDLVANVRKNSDNQFVYSVQLNENKNIEAAPSQVQLMLNREMDAHRFDDTSISQDESGVNTYSMQKSEKDAEDVSFMVSDSGVDAEAVSDAESQKPKKPQMFSRKPSPYHVNRMRRAMDAYRESGDVSGIPTRRTVDLSMKKNQHNLDRIAEEMAEIRNELSREDLTVDEMRSLLKRQELLEEHRKNEIKKNLVLKEIGEIVKEIDTVARPNHRWVEEIANVISDKTNIIKYGTYGFNDFERNLRNVFGKYFPLVKKKILDPLNQSKKAYSEYVESYSDRIYKEVVKGLGIKKGSKLSEAVQWLGEGERPIKKNRLWFGMSDGDKKNSSTADTETTGDGTYEPYDYERCRKEFGAETADRIKKAADIFRECYDQMLDDINSAREKLYPNNPDKQIKKRKDYFRHFREMNNSLPGLIQTMKEHAGISPELVGVSETTKSKSKFTSIGLTREGKRTKIDAVGGFLDYLPQAAYATHIDPNIVNIRSLAYDLAMAKAKDGANGNPNANSFIGYLQEFANHLAGKTVSPIDRKINKSTLGRSLTAAISWFNNRAKANAVLGNFSSMLSQFANIANIVGNIKHESDVLRGALDAGLGLFGNKEVRAEYENSGFLKERFLGKKTDRFDRYGLTRLAADALGIADEVGTRITWCAALREAERLGVSDKYDYADNLTRRCVAGRGIGEVPLNFVSTISKLFLPFRLEVNNNINVYRDILFGEDYEGEMDRKITSNMTDAQRYAILVEKSIVDIPKVNLEKLQSFESKPEVSIGELHLMKETDRKKLFVKMGEEFDVFKDYRNKDIELSFKFTRNGMRESEQYQKRNYDAFVKLFSCLDEVIDRAVGIEVHNRNGEGYKVDASLKEMYVLVSAFEDGENIIPVKLEIKEFNNKENNLYVALALECIKKNEVVKSEYADNSDTDNSRSFNISLAQILSIVKDKDFVKYIPKQFRNMEQTDFDEIVEAGQKKKPGKVKNAAVRTKNIMRLFVFSAIMNAIMGALKSDEFDPLEDLFGEGEDGVGDGVLFDPIGSTVRGVYQGWNENPDAAPVEKYFKGGQRAVQNVLGDWVSNDPLSQVVIGTMGVDDNAIDRIFNGSVYIPAGSGMPAISSVSKSIGYAFGEPENPKYGSAAAELFKTFGTPWGGSQLDKSVRGLYEYFTGASTTKRPYERIITGDDGNLKYLIEPNAENLVKSALFGPSSFSEANDAYYSSDYKKRLYDEDSDAVLKEDGYEARKSKFDEIMAENDYNSKETRANQQDAYANQYKQAAGEDSPIYQMYKDGFTGASPYNRIKMDLEGTTVTKHKFYCTLTVEEAEQATDELSKRIEERFLAIEDSENFLAMSKEDKEKYLSNIKSTEYYMMRAEIAFSKGAITEEDYEAQVESYERSVKKQNTTAFGEESKSTKNRSLYSGRTYSGKRKRNYSGGGRSLRASSGYSFQGNGYGYTGSSSYSGERRGGNRTSSGSVQKSSGTTKASGSGLGSLTFDDIMYHVKSSSGSSGSLGSGSGTAKTRSGVASKAQNGLRTKIKTSLRKTDFDDIL